MLHKLGLGDIALGELEQDSLNGGINGGSAHGRLKKSLGGALSGGAPLV